MSNYDDRGAYSPRNDEPLAFDARYPRGGERRPAPVALILSVAVLLLLAAGVFFYYRSGIRSDNEPPRVLGQPVGEMVSAPPASAQPANETSGLEIYRSEGAPAAQEQPSFAPEPEQPMSRPQAPAATPAPTPTATLRPAQPATPPAAQPAPAPAKPAPVAAKPAPAPAKPAPAAAKPTPAAVKPAPAVATPAKPTAAPVATKPAAAQPVAAKPAAAGGPASVQIGAFSDAGQADKGWNAAARLLPGDTAGHGKRVEKAEVNGATVHRTFVTGFASKADAQAYCAKLKAAGKGCFVR